MNDHRWDRHAKSGAAIASSWVEILPPGRIRQRRVGAD